MNCPDANPCAICTKLIVLGEPHKCVASENPRPWGGLRIPVGLDHKRKTGQWDRDSWGSHTVLERELDAE